MSNKEKSKVIGVTLDEFLYEELSEFAVKEKRSLSNAARVAIRRYFQICDIVNFERFFLTDPKSQTQSQK